jgi:LysR family transcriptional regulator for bpeEF and oprC
MDHHLLAIKVFARVVEAGSFTKASDTLNMPRPTMTKLIQNLESHLRVKLLNRTTRRVTVTADGAAYYERTARLLNELDDIESGMTNAQAKPHGRLRIDVGSSPACRFIIPQLHSFYERYPDIQLDFGVSDRVIDLVSDNVDCVIRAGEITDLSLVARKLADVPFITCATPEYLKTFGEPKTPYDIEDHEHYVVSYFSSRNGKSYPLSFIKDGEIIDIIGRYKIAVNDSSAHIAASCAGLGIFQGPMFVAHPHIENGELVQILKDWNIEPLPVYVVYSPNRHLSARCRVFVDWVIELFANHTCMQGKC